MKTTYVNVPATSVPAGLRFDVPGRNRGQIVEVAYADEKPFADEAGPGSMWRRTTDRSDGSVTYGQRFDRAAAIRTIRDYYMDDYIAERWRLRASTTEALVAFARAIIETEGDESPAAMERVNNAAADLECI